jgi:poly-beta-hydroxyalkanoate depolymerase
MLYALHEAAYYASTPMRLAALAARDFWGSPLNPAADSDLGRRVRAGADLFANVTRRYGKPDWNINTVKVGPWSGKALGRASSSSTATWPTCDGPASSRWTRPC